MSDWKDTVIGVNEQDYQWSDDYEHVKSMVEAQAEISFRAGEKQGIRKAIGNLKMHHCIVDVEARIKEIMNE